MFKNIKKCCVILALNTSLAYSASIDVTNYAADYPHTNIFTNGSGVALSSSFVGVGYFATLADSALSSLTPELLSQITTTSEFVQLDPLTLSEIGTAWVEAGGLSASFSAGITGLTNSSFIGKGIYVLMGNQSTLSGSTELLIAKSGVFAADAPAFSYSVTFDQSGGGGNANILWGGSNLFTGAISGGSTQPSYSTMGVSGVPEPSRMFLTASGILICLFRRRR